MDEIIVEVKGDTWKTRGIYDMIMLSTIEISHNFYVLFALMGFSSTSLNAYMFPWGMLIPTLLDVVAILGLPVDGKEVHAGPEFPVAGLVYENDTAFQNLLSRNAKTS